MRGEFYKELKKKEEDEFKEHTEKRVLNILENTVKFEAANFSAVNNTILDKALSALDTAVKGSNVQEESLQSSMAVLKNMGKGSKGGASDPLSTAGLPSPSVSIPARPHYNRRHEAEAGNGRASGGAGTQGGHGFEGR